MKSLKKIAVAFTALVALTIASCEKEDPTTPVSGTSTGYMGARMTEAGKLHVQDPSHPETSMLLISISAVYVHYTRGLAGSSGWVALNTNAESYDIYKLKDNVTAQIASQTRLPVGSIDQVRVVLGTEASFLLGGDAVYPLIVPAEYTDRGIVLGLDTEVSADVSKDIVLSVDAHKSVVQERGKYTLVPVMSVKGIVINQNK